VKKRTAFAPMKSQARKNDRKLFTQADREWFARIQDTSEVVQGRVSRYVYRSVLSRLVKAEDVPAAAWLVTAAEKTIRERYADRWDEVKGIEPALAWRTLAVLFTFLDNAPETPPSSVDEAKALRERVQARTQLVLDQCDCFEMDPAPGEQFNVDTTEDGQNGFNLVELTRRAAEFVAGEQAATPMTLDELFRDFIDAGGRHAAYESVRNMRRLGDLPKFHATQATHRIVNRAEYEALSRDQYVCSNLDCEGHGDAEYVEAVPWRKLVEEGVVEDGKVGVAYRDEEQQITRQVGRVMLYARPSDMESLMHSMQHRDVHGAFEVRS
jgi:hypothetical protein